MIYGGECEKHCSTISRQYHNLFPTFHHLKSERNVFLASIQPNLEWNYLIPIVPL